MSKTANQTVIDDEAKLREANKRKKDTENEEKMAITHHLVKFSFDTKAKEQYLIVFTCLSLDTEFTRQQLYRAAKDSLEKSLNAQTSSLNGTGNISDEFDSKARNDVKVEVKSTHIMKFTMKKVPIEQEVEKIVDAFFAAHGKNAIFAVEVQNKEVAELLITVLGKRLDNLQKNPVQKAANAAQIQNFQLVLGNLNDFVKLDELNKSDKKIGLSFIQP